MEILAALWILGLVVYFSVTDERQRENHLVVMWGLLLLPVIVYPLTQLFGP